MCAHVSPAVTRAAPATQTLGTLSCPMPTALRQLRETLALSRYILQMYFPGTGARGFSVGLPLQRTCTTQHRSPRLQTRMTGVG